MSNTKVLRALKNVYSLINRDAGKLTLKEQIELLGIVKRIIGVILEEMGYYDR